MRSLSEYNSVRISHVEIAIEHHIDDEKVAEALIALCRETMSTAPNAFWHFARVLRGFGHHTLIEKALSLANGD